MNEEKQENESDVAVYQSLNEEPEALPTEDYASDEVDFLAPYPRHLSFFDD